MARNQGDWKSQLASIGNQMYNEMSNEEKEKLNKEKEEERIAEKNRRKEFSKRQGDLWKFLAGYKQNSGIFINNFFRKRDYKTYCDDKFHNFDFTIGNVIPNVFDDIVFSMKMVKYLRTLEELKFAYHPITKSYIEYLINFAECFDYLPRTYDEIVVYRGCTNLDRNGVNGIVSTTTDYKIAEQFSRGTILKIHVPAGTKNINVKSIRPKDQQKQDTENEILLPPCDYEIISRKEIKPKTHPNNHTGHTELIELRVKPADLLEEFMAVMDNPPHEYLRAQLNSEFEEAYQVLRNYLDKRNKNQKKLDLK